jgi:hypothetical protein
VLTIDLDGYLTAYFCFMYISEKTVVEQDFFGEQRSDLSIDCESIDGLPLTKKKYRHE